MTRPASTRGLVYTTSTFSESTIAGKDTCFIPKSQNRSKQQDRDELRLGRRGPGTVPTPAKLDETPSIGRGMGGFCRHFALPLSYFGHHSYRKFSRIKTNILMVLHAIPDRLRSAPATAGYPGAARQ